MIWTALWLLLSCCLTMSQHSAMIYNWNNRHAIHKLMICGMTWTGCAADNEEGTVSLAKRIKTAQVNNSNTGCQTCRWWEQISTETQRLINAWLDDPNNSRLQLYEILALPGDDDPGEPLLPVSNSGWRMHLKHHDEKCR